MLQGFVDKFDLHIVVAVADDAKSVLVATLTADPETRFADKVTSRTLLFF